MTTCSIVLMRCTASRKASIPEPAIPEEEEDPDDLDGLDEDMFAGQDNITHVCTLTSHHIQPSIMPSIERRCVLPSKASPSPSPGCQVSPVHPVQACLYSRVCARPSQTRPITGLLCTGGICTMLTVLWQAPVVHTPAKSDNVNTIEVDLDNFGFGDEEFGFD